MKAYSRLRSRTRPPCQTASTTFAIASNTLRILSLDKLGDAFNAETLPLRYTPRRLAHHSASGNVVVVEADHNAYNDDEKAQLYEAAQLTPPLPAGTVLEGQILSIEEAQVNVSFVRVQKKIAWQRVTQLADLDVTVVATVLRLGDKGATLAIENLPAFLPWSHWTLPPAERNWRLQGMKLPVKFLEV